MVEAGPHPSPAPAVSPRQSRPDGWGLRLARVALMGLCVPVWASSGPALPSLTAGERAWLKAHPRIQLGMMDAWPPMNYTGKDGSPQGIGAAYAAALNKRLGGALILAPGPFEENCRKVLDGKLDAVMDITRRPEREALFTFTRPYVDIPHVLVGRTGGAYFRTEQDLAGRTLALEHGFRNVTYFHDQYPSVRVKEYGSTADALDAVSRGEADAYAGNRAVAVYLIEQGVLNNLRLMGRLAEPKSTLQIGVRKDRVILSSILDKALAAIPSEEAQAIQKKWVFDEMPPPEFTSAERAWLRAHPVLRVALDTDRAPIEFRDAHGVPAGISNDYLDLLSETLGVRFEVVEGRDWQALQEKGRQREVDVFPSLMNIGGREAYLAFSEVYYSLAIGVFIRKESPYAGSVADLQGKRVAVVRGHSPEYLLKTHHPGVRLVQAASPVEGLRLLDKGRVDAFVDATMSTSYYLGELALPDIRLTCEMPERYEQSMAVRSDWPELVPILNKALHAIPKSEQRAIYAKWTTLGSGSRIDYALVWEIAAGALLVVLLSGYWNWRMGKEIAGRKRTEAALRIQQERLEQVLAERTTHASELREAKERLGAIFQAANVGIVFLRNRVIQQSNAKLEEIFGYGPGELIGQPTRVWYRNEADYLQAGETIYRQVERGETHRGEQTLRRKDGSLFWARTTERALDPEHLAEGIVGVVEDITAEREAAEALRLASEEQQAILEAATSGIILAKDRVIVRCNRKLEEILGYGPGEMIGQKTRIWYSDEATFQDVGAGIAARGARGEVFARELQLVRKDASRFWGRMKVQSLDRADLSRGVVGVIEDVTPERERAEALRQALEAAEAADRIKSAFLATMSHELRTPLNSIIGFTGILLQGLVGPLNDEQKKQLGMVRDSSTHLLDLINDVLDISKIEAGQLEVVAEPFDLRASLEKIVRSLRPLADRRSLALELDIAPSVGVIAGDRRRVEQILLNLGSNALKFTDHGGVRIVCAEQGADLEIQVKDTGIGISAEDLATLFKPFRQVDAGTTRKYEGTGLGLSICKRLVELMGGSIRVESSPGQGSTFAFILPLKGGKP